MKLMQTFKRYRLLDIAPGEEVGPINEAWTCKWEPDGHPGRRLLGVVQASKGIAFVQTYDQYEVDLYGHDGAVLINVGGISANKGHSLHAIIDIFLAYDKAKAAEQARADAVAELALANGGLPPMFWRVDARAAQILSEMPPRDAPYWSENCPSEHPPGRVIVMQAPDTSMPEDELPADITPEDYDTWYAQSSIPGGVGCRFGPRFPATGGAA